MHLGVAEQLLVVRMVHQGCFKLLGLQQHLRAHLMELLLAFLQLRMGLLRLSLAFMELHTKVLQFTSGLIQQP